MELEDQHQPGYFLFNGRANPHTVAFQDVGLEFPGILGCNPCRTKGAKARIYPVDGRAFFDYFLDDFLAGPYFFSDCFREGSPDFIPGQCQRYAGRQVIFSIRKNGWLFSNNRSLQNKITTDY